MAPGPDAAWPPGPPPAFDDPRLDALVAMIVELAQELWVARAEIAALAGLPAEALAAERAAFVARFLAPIERL